MSLWCMPPLLAITTAAGVNYALIDQGAEFTTAGDYIRRQNGSGGDRQKVILSAWVRRSNPGTRTYIFQAANTTGTLAASDTGTFTVDIRSTDEIRISGGSSVWRVTTAKFRDPTAWFHFLLVIDSSQGAAEDRMRLYINGTEVTSFSTNNPVPANLNFPMNANTYYQGFGSGGDSWNSFAGNYLAQALIQDGQTLGSLADYLTTDDAPKDVSGLTVGSQGGLYEFGNGSDLGEATNGNDMTAAGSGEQVENTPTNNLAIFNSVANLGTISDAGRQLTIQDYRTPLTFPIDSGKWRWDIELDAVAGSAGNTIYGLEPADTFNHRASDATIVTGPWTTTGFLSNGNKSLAGATPVAYGSNWHTAGKVITLIFDADLGALWAAIDGALQNSATAAEINAGTTTNALATGLTSGPYWPVVGSNNVSCVHKLFADEASQQTITGLSVDFKILSCAHRSEVTPASGSFTGNANADGPVIALGYNPESLTIDSSAVTFGTDADRLALGTKIRTASSPYNDSGTNNYSLPTERRDFANTNDTIPLAELN